MERATVSKEEVEADLDRVKIAIGSTPIGVTSSILEKVFHKYVNVLRKLTYKASNHTIDEHAMKIIQKDGITLKNNIQPVRYELDFVFLNILCYYYI